MSIVRRYLPSLTNDKCHTMKETKFTPETHALYVFLLTCLRWFPLEGSWAMMPVVQFTSLNGIFLEHTGHNVRRRGKVAGQGHFSSDTINVSTK